MKLKAITAIKNRAEARTLAIDYQNWASKRNLSYGELGKYQSYFELLAKKFNLKTEFKENCII